MEYFIYSQEQHFNMETSVYKTIFFFVDFMEFHQLRTIELARKYFVHFAKSQQTFGTQGMKISMKCYDEKMKIKSKSQRKYF